MQNDSGFYFFVNVVNFDARAGAPPARIDDSVPRHYESRHDAIASLGDLGLSGPWQTQAEAEKERARILESVALEMAC